MGTDAQWFWVRYRQSGITVGHTFPGIIAQDGPHPHLFALGGLAGARLRARGP